MKMLKDTNINVGLLFDFRYLLFVNGHHSQHYTLLYPSHTKHFTLLCALCLVVTRIIVLFIALILFLVSAL